MFVLNDRECVMLCARVVGASAWYCVFECLVRRWSDAHDRECAVLCARVVDAVVMCMFGSARCCVLEWLML